MLRQWLWNIVWYAKHFVLCWASACELTCVSLSQWLWMMVCYAEQVVVNHGKIWWAICCESLFAMLRQWLWIMRVVMNHCELYRGSGCESCSVLLNHRLWFIVSAVPVVVKHGELCWASVLKSWCAILYYLSWIICVLQVKVNYRHYSLMGQMSAWVIVV